MSRIQHRHELLSELWKIQDQFGYISQGEMQRIADALNISVIEVAGVVSFYHFFHDKPGGKYHIYLNNSIIAEHSGYRKIKKAFEEIAGVRFGVRNPNRLFSLHETACIGLSDSEPACLIDFYPFTNLTISKVNRIIGLLKAGSHPKNICDHPISEVKVLAQKGQGILFRDYIPGKGLERLKEMEPGVLLQMLVGSGLSGMGGAFFPAFIKWKSCRAVEGQEKYIVCNADEGEPGTFKDRALLQRVPGLVLEGMILAGRVVGAKEGIIYLRAEYRYLVDQLQLTINLFKEKNLLGKNILGIPGFDFNISIQLGAGAYVCGEETALLQSMEGFRGEPRTKIFFPTERGYKDKPTVVNNVETLAMAARIAEIGVEEYQSYGSKGCEGTKLISVSGDCKHPGVYEIEWGMTLREVLNVVKAENVFAVQVSGPSGELCFDQDFDRIISKTDLACGGSVMIYDYSRDLFDVLQNYNHFFTSESCGVCTPCRVGGYILKKEIEQLKAGMSDYEDYRKVYEWSNIMKSASRCGLGQTAPKAFLQAIDKKPEYFSSLLTEEHLVNVRFDLQKATQLYEDVVSKK